MIMEQLFRLFVEDNKDVYNNEVEKQMLNEIRTIVTEYHLNNFDSNLIYKKISSIKSNKKKRIDMINKFIAFINEKKDMKLNQISQVALSKQDRQIELIKLLHTKKKRKDILDQLAINERTLRSDLLELEKGVKIFNTNVKINTNRKEESLISKSDTYHSSVHPIGLVLNLTEVYALTVGILHKMDRYDEDYQIYLTLASKIYNQLSEYAKSIIKKSNTKKHEFLSAEDSFLHEHKALEMYIGNKFNYALKRGSRVLIQYNHNNNDSTVPYEGIIRPNPKKHSSYILKTTDNQIIDLDINNIESLIIPKYE